MLELSSKLSLSVMIENHIESEIIEKKQIDNKHFEKMNLEVFKMSNAQDFNVYHVRRIDTI